MFNPRKPKLRNGLINFLEQQKQKIAALDNYKAKVELAAELWKNKKKKKSHRSAFNDIEKALKESNPYHFGLCSYCEFNNGTEIDHIYPKVFYPEKTFDIQNMLWTCSTCNQQYKASRFSIFNKNGEIEALIKNQKFTNPATDDALFIHPYQDNLKDYIRLCSVSGLYFPTDSDSNAKKYIRAKFTIDKLGLNTRKEIIESRICAINAIKDLKQKQNNSLLNANEIRLLITGNLHTSIWLNQLCLNQEIDY